MIITYRSRCERSSRFVGPLLIDGDRCPVGVKSRKSHSEQMLSALPPKADIKRGVSHVRFVPRADIASLPRYVRSVPKPNAVRISSGNAGLRYLPPSIHQRAAATSQSCGKPKIDRRPRMVYSLCTTLMCCRRTAVAGSRNMSARSASSR